MVDKIIEKIQIRSVKAKITKAVKMPEDSFKENLLLTMKSELSEGYFVAPTYKHKNDTLSVSQYFLFMNKKLLQVVAVAAVVVTVIANSSLVGVALAANDIKQQVSVMSDEDFVATFRGVSKDDLVESLSIKNTIKNATIISAEEFKKDLMENVFPSNLPKGVQVVSVSSDSGIVSNEEQIKRINDSIPMIDRVLKVKDLHGNVVEIALDKEGKVVSAFAKAEVESLDQKTGQIQVSSGAAVTEGVSADHTGTTSPAPAESVESKGFVKVGKIEDFDTGKEIKIQDLKSLNQ